LRIEHVAGQAFVFTLCTLCTEEFLAHEKMDRAVVTKILAFLAAQE